MKSFSAVATTAVALFSCTVSSAPLAERAQPNTVTLTLANDFTGARASVDLPFGKTVWWFGEILYDTPLDIWRNSDPSTGMYPHTSFLATSAELTSGLQYPVQCAIQSNDGGLQQQRIDRQLNQRQTYVKFGTSKTDDGQPKLELTELRAAFVQCDILPEQA